MQVRRSALEAVHRHLTAAYPAEGCGLLLGARGSGAEVVVSRGVAVPNRREPDGQARNRYLLSPDDVRAAERDAGAAGLEIVGVYHSHPDAGARPSAYDRDNAWPWYRYLIVSVVGGEVREARVWELTDDRRGFVEHALRVEEQ